MIRFVSACICHVQEQLVNGFKVEHIVVIPTLQIVEEVVEVMLLPPAAHRQANCACIQDQTVDIVMPSHRNECLSTLWSRLWAFLFLHL